MKTQQLECYVDEFIHNYFDEGRALVAFLRNRSESPDGSKEHTFVVEVGNNKVEVTFKLPPKND